MYFDFFFTSTLYILRPFLYLVHFTTAHLLRPIAKYGFIISWEVQVEVKFGQKVQVSFRSK